MLLLLALVLGGCAESEQVADVSWLINEKSEKVMGLLASAGSDDTKHFSLLECGTYDSFTQAATAYANERGLPNDCRILIAKELTSQDLQQAKVKTGKLQKVLAKIDRITTGAGALIIMFGLSGKHVELLKSAIDRAKELEFLPRLAKMDKIKNRRRVAFIMGAATLLAKTVEIWTKDSKQYNQIIEDELNGARYQNYKGDQILSAGDYQAVQQMLLAMTGNKRPLPRNKVGGQGQRSLSPAN